MPSNTTLNPGSSGDVMVTKERTHDGDAAKQQGVFLSVVTGGTEGSYTWADIGGSAANGLEVDVTRVQGTVTVDNGGTFAVQAAQSGTWNINNVSGTVSLPTGAATSANQSTANTSLSNIEGGYAAEGSALGSGVLLQGDDGTDRKNINVDATTGDVQVDITHTVTVDGSGVTQPVSGTVTANAGTGTFTVDGSGVTQPVSGTITASNTAGDVAHDTADSGNPVKVGGKAESDIDTITLVADGDRTDFLAGRDGIQYVHQDGPLENLVNGQATMTASTANTAAIAAQGAGIKTYVTDCIVTNTSATDTEVIIKDGTTEKFRISAPANGGAVSVGIRSPIAGTANTAWNAAAADSVSSVYCFLSGFTSQI